MKKLCKLTEKETAHRLELLLEDGGPRHLCRRCARAARKKDALCKPQKIRREKPKARR